MEELGPHVNQLISRINNWNIVCEGILTNESLKMIVVAAL
jgi:hypothetical protein